MFAEAASEGGGWGPVSVSDVPVVAGRGSVEVVDLTRCSESREREPGDVNIQRGTVLGTPFLLGGEGDRDDAVCSYWRLLGGDVGAHALGRETGLRVHESSARVTHARRLHALRQLSERVVRGDRVRLTCGCAPRLCHGHAVKAWVERDVARRIAGAS